MPLFLFRHGETVFNVAGRFQGQNDSPLTDRGISQARTNASRLSALIKDSKHIHFVSSPLGRTLKTSEHICHILGLDTAAIQTDKRLMEMNYGAWQGLTVAEIEQEYPGLWAQRNAEPDTFKIPGNGESYEDVNKRIDDWLSETRNAWDQDRVWIVVSHGGTGSVIRGRYLGLSTQETRGLERPHDCFYEFKDHTIAEHWDEESTPLDRSNNALLS